MKNFVCGLIIQGLLLGSMPTWSLAQAPQVQSPAGPAQASDTNYGLVTVGTPKIWSFDRIYSTLDGLLRDLDAVQLASLAALNANESNQALLDFLTTSLNVKADFNARGALQNELELGKVQALRPTELQRLQAFNQRMRQAEVRRVEVERQLAEAQDRLAKLDPDAENFDRDKKREEAKIAALTTERTDLGTVLSQTPPQLTSVDTTKLDTSQGITPTPLPTPLINASDLKEALIAKLNAKDPSLPATKQLDNFATLLHERLSRQLSASFDDNAADKDLFLVKFDVGIYPRKDSENHLLRVEFDLGGGSGAGALAYDLYPGLSAYNMTEYWGKSRGTGIAGSAAFLFGFGLGVEYKRQRDQVRSAATQNVYISGFGAGTSKFGWHFGPSPFEKLITPGIHSAYAILALDKAPQRLTLTPRVGWFHRSKSDAHPLNNLADLTVDLPNPRMTISRLAYQTTYLAEETKPNGENGGQGNAEDKTEQFGTIQIAFDQPIDPNLVITVNGTLLKRLRDVRGRATTQKSAATSAGTDGPKDAAFGLLETDAENGSYWFALGAKSISLKLAKSLVKTESFPRIRLLSAGENKGVELLTLLRERRSWQDQTRVEINDWRFKLYPLQEIPPSAFTPLFSTVDFVEDIEAWRDGQRVHIRRHGPASGNGTSRQAPLDGYAQVVLIDGESNTPLHCRNDRSGLVCDIPQGKSQMKEYRIAVERSSWNGLRGIATQQVRMIPRPPLDLPRLTGGYTVSRMTSTEGAIRSWRLRLPAENLDQNRDFLGVEETSQLLHCDPSPNASPAVGGVTCRMSQNAVELLIPVRSLGAVIGRQLFLQRAPDLRIPLPEIAPLLLPEVSEITQEAGSIVLTGNNLDLVEQIEFRGCGRRCGSITYGVSKGLISFFPPQEVKGVYPIAFQLIGGLVVEATKQNGGTWAIVFQPQERRERSISLEHEGLMAPPPPQAGKESKGGSAPRKEQKVFLLSPPAPAPLSSSEVRRHKQNTAK